jgi:EF hand
MDRKKWKQSFPAWYVCVCVISVLYPIAPTVRFTRRIVLCAQDQDHDNKIMYTEFLAATMEAQGYIAEERVAEAFDRLDADETGYSKCLGPFHRARALCGAALHTRAPTNTSLNSQFVSVSKEDLREALGEDCDPEEIDNIIAVRSVFVSWCVVDLNSGKWPLISLLNTNPVQSADMNRDGKISYEEFLAVFRAQTSAKMMSLEGALDDDVFEAPANGVPATTTPVGLDGNQMADRER